MTIYPYLEERSQERVSPGNRSSKNFQEEVAVMEIGKRLELELVHGQDPFQFGQKWVSHGGFTPSFLHSLTLGSKRPLIGEKVGEGQKRMILIVSNWRSGSSFLGHLLNHLPGAWYFFEPLFFAYQSVLPQMRDTFQTKVVEDLLQCKYHESIAEADMKKMIFFFRKTSRVWDVCGESQGNGTVCNSKSFLEEACRYFPLQVIKSVRLRYKAVQELIRRYPNLKVIGSVRDPRGALHSRSKLDWCKVRSCIDPETVCDKLHEDMMIASQLRVNHPHQFLLLRYEDLSLNTTSTVRRVLNFLDMEPTALFNRFVKDSTKGANEEEDDPYATKRNSRKVALDWRHNIAFSDVLDIQKSCAEVMKMLGYNLLASEEDLRNDNCSILSKLDV